MPSFPLSRSFIVPAIAVAGLALGIGVAYSAIPDTEGTIDACYRTSNGQLRVIDSSAGQQCTPSESPLSWQQDGGGGLTEVRSEDIVDGEVASQDIGEGEVKTANIDDGSVTADKLAEQYALATGLEAEETARVAADAVLTSDLSAEESARSAFDSGLSAAGGGPVHYGNITDVAVTGTDVADGTLTADDLADGSVTTSKQTANSSIGTGGAANVPAGAPTAVATAILTLPEAGGGNPGHNVMLAGQTQLSCESCLPATPPTTVTVQVFSNDVAVSPPVSATVVHGVTVTLPLFWLLLDEDGTTAYQLVVSHSGAVDISATSNTLVAVDLGR